MHEEMDFEAWYPHHDPPWHLTAIKSMLESLFNAERVLDANIVASGKTISSDLDLEDHIVLYYSDFFLAAMGYAAVGALAPFFEGFLTKEFTWMHYLHDRGGEERPRNGNERWNGVSQKDEFWSPTKFFESGSNKFETNIVRGVPQLWQAVGLDNSLLDNLNRVLEPLFIFRNRALHQGYEWKKDERGRFLKLVEEKGWGEYFSFSSEGEKPHIFCPTKKLIDDSLQMAHQLIDYFSQLENDRNKRFYEESNSPENLAKFLEWRNSQNTG